MTFGISEVISLCALCLSAGLFAGLFTLRFLPRKDFNEHVHTCKTERDEDRREIWSAIDSIRGAMMGGEMKFTVQITPQKQVAA